MKIEISRSMELDRWIAEHHYLKSTPAGARIRMWVLDDNNNRIGAMMWGRPVSRNLDQSSLLELTRMYLVDETEKNAESKALAMARKHIRKHYPEVKGVIAYSSTGQGHEGTIYQADNWFEMGRTKVTNKGWESRENRTMRDASEKIKWARSV